MGHALYEQGINTEFEATPLANGTSNSVSMRANLAYGENPLLGVAAILASHPQLQVVFPLQCFSGDVLSGN